MVVATVGREVSQSVFCSAFWLHLVCFFFGAWENQRGTARYGVRRARRGVVRRALRAGIGGVGGPRRREAVGGLRRAAQDRARVRACEVGVVHPHPEIGGPEAARSGRGPAGGEGLRRRCRCRCRHCACACASNRGRSIEYFMLLLPLFVAGQNKTTAISRNYCGRMGCTFGIHREGMGRKTGRRTGGRTDGQTGIETDMLRTSQLVHPGT